MHSSKAEFFSSALNSLPDQLAIIESSGEIVFVNRAWKNFAVSNDCEHIDNWLGINYLTVCQQGAQQEDEYCTDVFEGLTALIKGDTAEFYIEYPCHSPSIQRWFYMRAVKLDYQGSCDYFILVHHDITERVLAELTVVDLSMLDHLTGLKNRRAFDQLYEREWRQCLRANTPITVALLDIDYFKQYNDAYGHVEGDKCLQTLGHLFKAFENRSTDFVARYGGEEFIFVFGNTGLSGASNLLTKVMESIKALSIPHKQSPHQQIMTVSIGLATIIPTQHIDKMDLIEKADQLLYEAKGAGRNRMKSQWIKPKSLTLVQKS